MALNETPAQRTLDLAAGSTLVSRVYEVLKDRILSRELRPGTRLKHADLASALGVSSTPVREAIKQLEKDGLVEAHPYRGSIVKRMSAKEIRDIQEVRIALESLATRLAASVITDSQLQELGRYAADYESALESDDRALGITSDLAFHELILKVAGNTVLLAIASELATRIQVVRQVDWGQMSRTQSLHGHRLILDALRTRNGAGAARLMAEHIGRGTSKVLQALAPEEPGANGVETGRGAAA